MKEKAKNRFCYVMSLVLLLCFVMMVLVCDLYGYDSASLIKVIVVCYRRRHNQSTLSVMIHGWLAALWRLAGL